MTEAEDTIYRAECLILADKLALAYRLNRGAAINRCLKVIIRDSKSPMLREWATEMKRLEGPIKVEKMYNLVTKLAFADDLIVPPTSIR